MGHIKFEAPKGKFFIIKRAKYLTEYYVASGIRAVGTPAETRFIEWDKYWSNAHGFENLTAARRILADLREQYGSRVSIVDRSGEVVKEVLK